MPHILGPACQASKSGCAKAAERIDPQSLLLIRLLCAADGTLTCIPLVACTQFLCLPIPRPQVAACFARHCWSAEFALNFEQVSCYPCWSIPVLYEVGPPFVGSKSYGKDFRKYSLVFRNQQITYPATIMVQML